MEILIRNLRNIVFFLLLLRKYKDSLSEIVLYISYKFSMHFSDDN